MIDAETGAQVAALEPVAEAPDAKLAAITAVIDRWMVERIYSSPVSRSTDAINHLNAQLPALASALALEI
jgi:hypothetical protein